MMTMLTPKTRTVQGYVCSCTLNKYHTRDSSQCNKARMKKINKNTHWKGRKRKYLTA